MARRLSKVVAFLIVAPLIAVTPAAAQRGNGHGGGGGSQSGGGSSSSTGDVFGDLIEIKRDATTGVPILAQRWVELPKELRGYGWGYCPIALDAAGNEIPFLPLTCDPDTTYATVPVDYFGRLSASRTQEQNLRMHFDEVIANIKAAQAVDFDEAGRIRMWSACTQVGDVSTCDPASWSVIDSALENLGLYHRLLKYGHMQTNPLEIDVWWHGDPAAGTVYHPALDASDWKKFAGGARTLLPRGGDPLACFSTTGAYLAGCEQNEALTGDDLIAAASFVGGAAGKSNWITADLVQYLNRALKITVNTTTRSNGGTTPTLSTVPAKVRDCWPYSYDPPTPSETDPAVDPIYGACVEYDATSALPNYTVFPSVQEQFVNFAPVAYNRSALYSNRTVDIIKPTYPNDPVPLAYQTTFDYPLMDWLAFSAAKYGTGATGTNIVGFVNAASDSLRAIEFIHNYELPAVLWNWLPPQP